MERNNHREKYMILKKFGAPQKQAMYDLLQAIADWYSIYYKYSIFSFLFHRKSFLLLSGKTLLGKTNPLNLGWIQLQKVKKYYKRRAVKIWEYKMWARVNIQAFKKRAMQQWNLATPDIPNVKNAQVKKIN